MRLRGRSRGSGQPGPRVLDHLCGGGWLPSSVMVETAPSDFDARNGLVVARIPRDTDMDAIGPLGWRKLVPFAPVVTSDRLGWMGLEAARFRASPGGEVFHPALTHHMLVLFTAPPREIELRYEGVTRRVPPPADSSCGYCVGQPLVNSSLPAVELNSALWVMSPSKMPFVGGKLWRLPAFAAWLGGFLPWANPGRGVWWGLRVERTYCCDAMNSASRAWLW